MCGLRYNRGAERISASAVSARIRIALGLTIPPGVLAKPSGFGLPEFFVLATLLLGCRSGFGLLAVSIPVAVKCLFDGEPICSVPAATTRPTENADCDA
jgi:hypothetical protein